MLNVVNVYPTSWNSVQINALVKILCLFQTTVQGPLTSDTGSNMLNSNELRDRTVLESVMAGGHFHMTGILSTMWHGKDCISVDAFSGGFLKIVTEGNYNAVREKVNYYLHLATLMREGQSKSE